MIIIDRVKGIFSFKEAFFLLVILLGSFPLWVRAESPTPAQRAEVWLTEVRLPMKNYVKNGGFESGADGWEYFEHRSGGIDDKVVSSGKASFRMDGFDENKYTYFRQRNIPLETNKTYTMSAMIKAEDIPFTCGAFSLLYLVNAGWSAGTTLTSTTARIKDWTYITKTFVPPETKPRPDGKPEYTMNIFWPPKNKGQIWFDNIQIEEGDKATEYSDIYVGDGINALEKLKGLAQQIFATQDALANFKEGSLLKSLTEALTAINTQAEGIKADLNKMGSLPKAAREGLVPRITECSAKLAGIRTVVWTGPAHIPLNEVALPAAKPSTLSVELTCLQGEHRDIALNIGNMTPAGYASRVIVSELYNEQLALRVAPLEWVTVYSVPRMRGYQKPQEVFTDALPEVDGAGIIQVEPAAISQAIVSLDTAKLTPGDYAGKITIASLLDGANRQEIAVKLKVLPMALLPIKNVDIAECMGQTEYAWDAMKALGVNTFDINNSWMDVDFDEEGNLKRIDFARINREIVRELAAVPDARFLCFGGQGIMSFLQGRYGWKDTDPRTEKAFKAWIKALAENLKDFKVEPSRLIIETYDEPGEGDFPLGIKQSRWIHEVEPRIQTQFYWTGIDTNEAAKGLVLAHDIPSPIVGACNEAGVMYLKGLGKKLWVYDCQADGETLHPIAYYRLMPWMCRKYGIQGWGHYSWFGTSHGRNYRAWEGVEAQNLVYPALDGKGMVISRRFLGMRAGNEDYQVLDALERVIAQCAAGNEQEAVKAKEFIGQAYEQALQISPRERGYQTHIAASTPAMVMTNIVGTVTYQTHIAASSPADQLDTLREEAVKHIAKLLPAAEALQTALKQKGQKAVVTVKAPEKGKLRVQYLVEGNLPWKIFVQEVSAAETDIALGDAGEVNRCLVEYADSIGRLQTGTPLIIPRIRVDSVQAPYSQLPLNDGIRVEAVKFEPQFAWISSGDNVEHWVEVDLGAPREVSEVGLYWMTFTGLPQKTMVQYFDKGAWQSVSATPAWRPAAAAVEKIKFTPVMTDKLRILQAAGGGGRGGPTLMGLSEVEIR